MPSQTLFVFKIVKFWSMGNINMANKKNSSEMDTVEWMPSQKQLFPHLTTKFLHAHDRLTIVQYV